ncbi:hypothetical protein PG997_008897 [Apiospora hydei]|uniref:Uncharacterized protein n=1 Tax=Apiospora hydei TaxID=1337664 RepID=A0ABR1WFY9_9PEZI
MEQTEPPSPNASTAIANTFLALFILSCTRFLMGMTKMIQSAAMLREILARSLLMAECPGPGIAHRPALEDEDEHVGDRVDRHGRDHDPAQDSKAQMATLLGEDAQIKQQDGHLDLTKTEVVDGLRDD